jgi:3-oxoacyl-[acyl-carrier-protein] synthase III
MSTLNAVISGTGMSVPPTILTNHDLERLVDTSDEWITTRTGIKERRIAAEGDSLSQYSIEAGRRALEAAGIGPEELDMVILATVTPDMPIPATACTVQHALGCKNAAAFDISAGCSGFLYAQSVAKQFLINGRLKHILVIGAELLSKYLDWGDRATCVIFADGAGAVVMSGGAPPRGVLASALHTDGSLVDYICMPGGGVLHPPGQAMIDQRLHYIQMRGNETFKMAVRSIEEVCREVLAAAELTAADVDWFVPHQANRRIIDAVGTRMEIPPERCYVNIDRYGNTSSASIPIALDEAVRSGQIRRGHIVLMAAFGAGLTWGASVVRW